MLFCDWHMPNFLPEVKINYDEYFEQIKRTGAETLIFQAKTAHGAAFYPTEVGIVNQTMEGDLFGEIAHRAQAAGLEFISYYNMVLSWELHRLHPEWEQIGADGNPLRMFLYPCYCMSNDEFRDHVCAHMAECTAKYPMDGWFLDLQYFSPEGCYCTSCREKFAERFGYDLAPASFTTASWLDFYTYQVDTREQFLKASRDACNAVKPGLSWSWNGCGSPVSISATLHHGADYLSTEAHPPGYLHAEYATRYCEGLGMPFTLFMPESQGSWGDWTVTTPETIKGLSAVALAHGGSLNINHVPYPCGDYGGSVPQVIWDTIKETFDWVAQREEFCTGKAPVPVVGVIHSAENAKLLAAMSRQEKYAHLRYEMSANEQALAQLLGELHIPWEIRFTDITLEEMRQYELLIVPFIPHISEELGARLREYVRGGGKLLATWTSSLFDKTGEQLENFTLADLFGVDFKEVSRFSVSYIDDLDAVFQPTVPDMPLLLKDAASGVLNPKNRVLCTHPHSGTQTLARIMDPVIESDFNTGHYVYHDHAPPGYRTDYPAIARNEFGRGEVIYLPVPFMKAYITKHSPFLKELFRVLVQDVLHVSEKVHVTAPGVVKSALMHDSEGWLLHLVHLQKETDSMYLDSFYRPDPITVRVKPNWPVQAARECVSGAQYDLQKDGEWTQFTIPGIHNHLVVRIAR